MRTSLRSSIALLAILLASASPVASQVVRGQLMDATNGEPIAGATLSVVGGDNSLRARTEANAAGDFLLTFQGDGIYRINAIHPGYRPAVSNPLILEPGDTLTVEIRLSPQVVLLDSIRVISRGAERQRALLRDFYDRRDANTFGRFITREDLQRSRPIKTTDAIALIPGMRLLPPGPGGGSAIRLRGNCSPTIYIDGVRANMGSLTVDDMVNPMEIEGIEVYRTVAEAPPQYQGLLGGCSAILLWTRID